MNEKKLIYQIALTQLKGIGPKNALKLLHHFGTPEAIFQADKIAMMTIPGIGNKMAHALINNFSSAIHFAEKELLAQQEQNIKPVFYTDNNFPSALKECDDSPIMLYQKGNINIKNKKLLAIVGTRRASNYGKEACKNLIAELADRHDDIVIISGLAYGIDVCAHRAAIENNIPTIAVLGSGFNCLYPREHRATAQEIIQHPESGLISEFPINTKIEKYQFLMRNRIIAGLSCAIIVIESAAKGGALVTADIAHSYDRDVLAFPGRSNDKYSEGCNYLIKSQKAAMIESASDLEKLMNWDIQNTIKKKKKKIIMTLNEKEKYIYAIIQQENKIQLDSLALHLKINSHQLSPILLQMECKAAIKCLPGKLYCCL